MKNTSVKKVNIHLQRKLTVLYTRTIFFIKIFIAIVLYCIFYTNYLSGIREMFAQRFYDISANCGLKIKNVVIEGLENIEEQKIISALNTKANNPIFQIDIHNVQKELSKNPWIKSVVVKRILPNTIHIVLYENKPIAKWQYNNQVFLIDEEGNILSEGYPEKFAHLIHVVGKGANLYTKQLIDELNKSPELVAKLVSAVRYGQRRWDLNFVQNITVKMPENNFSKAYYYLIELNNHMKFFNQNYKVLDLRDNSKAYIEKYQS